jgi:CRISPR system Cascade subunit CasB
MTTTQATTLNRLDYEIHFLKSVGDRIKNDKGAQADFKRAMSGEPQHIRKVYQFILPYVGKASEWQQEQIWIPVACLSVYYPQTLREEEKQRNFGHSCHGLAIATNSDGADRRFRALLDLALTDIQSPLTALVRQMKSKGVSIDYPQLLADLKRWEHPNQYVQDQWARSFWGASQAEDLPEAGGTDDE